jgi:hypothetical protein
MVIVKAKITIPIKVINNDVVSKVTKTCQLKVNKFQRNCMSYIKDSLGNDEQFEFHWSIWISFFILAFIAILSFIGWILSLSNPSTDNVSMSLLISVLCGLGALYQLLEVRASGRALANKIVVTKSGIVSVHTEETRENKY